MRRHAPPQPATASPSSTCCGRTCRPTGWCSRSRAARASTPCISPPPCPHLVFQPSDPDAEARASIDDWAATQRPCQCPAGDGARRRRRAAWPVEQADAVLCMQHDPHRALGGGRRPDRAAPAASCRPAACSISTARTAAAAGTPRRATRPSTATSASAIPPGACATSRRSAALAAADGFARAGGRRDAGQQPVRHLPPVLT